ncbi:hypothetical protein STEG23_006371 [Scotinomys teguina]
MNTRNSMAGMNNRFAEARMETTNEVEIGRSLCSPTFSSHPESQADDSVKDSDLKGEETSLHKMSPKSGHSHSAEG